MKKILKGCILVGILTVSTVVYAARAVDLITVYEEGLANDPIFRAAISTKASIQEGVPQALAVLLPQLNLSASAEDERLKTLLGGAPAPVVVSTGAHNFTLSLSQAVLDYGKIASLRQALSISKQAEATLQIAAQDLIVRVAAAYLSVLEAEDNLRFTRAEKRANARQLDQAKERFKVGLDAITSVYDAQSAYDAVVASEITAKNAVLNARERLREITGVYHEKLYPVGDRIPLVKPNPQNVKAWISQAAEHNFTILSAKYAVEAAKQNIQVNFAGHFPVVNLIGGYTDANMPSIGFGTNDTENTTIGLQLALPIYEGGLRQSQTRQAYDDYETARAQLLRAIREQLSLTHQAYNNVLSGIGNIKANRQAIVSTNSSVESSEAAMRVGTRTIVDVLDAQQRLYDAQRIHAAAQYNYINNMLALKQAAGMLTRDDLERINRWVQKVKRSPAAAAADLKNDVFKDLIEESTKTAKKIEGEKPFDKKKEENKKPKSNMTPQYKQPTQPVDDQGASKIKRATHVLLQQNTKPWINPDGKLVRKDKSIIEGKKPLEYRIARVEKTNLWSNPDVKFAQKSKPVRKAEVANEKPWLNPDIKLAQKSKPLA